MEATTVEAADRAARQWGGDDPGPIRPGSEQHKRLFSRMLLDTFNPYKPAVIDWPALDAAARDRLVSLPIWDIAVQTEGKASRRVKSYAETIADPLLRQAIELNGFEEARHKTVLANMVRAYGIALAPEPDYPAPRDPEWAFMVTGYSECIDSFFAFGLFEVAKRSGFFPSALVDTFEPVMQEEGRHITFFVNWVAWHRRNLPWWQKPLFQAKILAVWAFLIWERIGIARDLGGAPQDNNFTVTGSKSVGVDITPGELMDICLAENDRRLAGYDPAPAPAALRAGHGAAGAALHGQVEARRGADRLGCAQGAVLPPFRGHLPAFRAGGAALAGARRRRLAAPALGAVLAGGAAHGAARRRHRPGVLRHRRRSRAEATRSTCRASRRRATPS